MDIKIKLLSDLAKVPTKANPGDAGTDLYAAIDKRIPIVPHQTVKIPTDIAVEIPEGYFGGIFARSGLATKNGIRPSNCTGVIDSKYRGNVIVALHNDTDLTYFVTPGERIAQLIVIPFAEQNFKVIKKLQETERGNSGFGSSGAL